MSFINPWDTLPLIPHSMREQNTKNEYRIVCGNFFQTCYLISLWIPYTTNDKLSVFKLLTIIYVKQYYFAISSPKKKKNCYNFFILSNILSSNLTEHRSLNLKPSLICNVFINSVKFTEEILMSR